MALDVDRICSSSYGLGQFSITALSFSTLSGFGLTTIYTTEFPASRLTGYDIYAYSVQVRFQSTKSVLPTTSLLSTLMPIVPPSPLSPGAIAGIGVSVTLIFLGIIVGSFFCLQRRRQHQKTISEPEAADRNNVHGLFLKPELEAIGPSEKRDPKPHIAAAIPELESSTVAAQQNQNIANELESRTSSPPLASHTVESSHIKPSHFREGTTQQLPEQSFVSSVIRKPVLETTSTSSQPVSESKNAAFHEPSLSTSTVSKTTHPPSSQQQRVIADIDASSFSRHTAGAQKPEEPENAVGGKEGTGSLQQEIERIREERERLLRLIELGKREEGLRQRVLDGEARESG